MPLFKFSSSMFYIMQNLKKKIYLLIDMHGTVYMGLVGYILQYLMTGCMHVLYEIVQTRDQARLCIYTLKPVD